MVPDRRLTPTGSNTSKSVKCSRCGSMFSLPEPPELPGQKTCMTCPACGMENCVETSWQVDASDEDY
ncbi:MAG: hypothetical protein NUW23_09240 [Firmicutes bacterium]|nr:hypothetical protein [Bacillota bacterium]